MVTKTAVTPNDIRLPQREQLEQFIGSLNDAARRQFLEDLLDALRESKRDDDLKALQETLTAWLRSRQRNLRR